MADGACSFCQPGSYPSTPWLLLGQLADPVDFGAVIMPLTALIDTTKPVATLISPAVLSNVEPHTPIVIEMADNKQLSRVFAWVEYSNAPAEAIFARGIFMPDFTTSTVEELSLNVRRRFTFRRNLGWPSAPFIWIEGVDIDGNVST